MKEDLTLGGEVMTDGWGKKHHFKSLRPRWKPMPVRAEPPKPVPKPVKATILPAPKEKTPRRKTPERKDVSHPDVKIGECVICKPHRFYGYVPVGDDEIAASRKNRIVERVCDRHEEVKDGKGKTDQST